MATNNTPAQKCQKCNRKNVAEHELWRHGNRRGSSTLIGYICDGCVENNRMEPNEVNHPF